MFPSHEGTFSKGLCMRYVDKIIILSLVLVVNVSGKCIPSSAAICMVKTKNLNLEIYYLLSFIKWLSI